MDIWIGSTFWPLWMMLLWTLAYTFWCEYLFSFLLSIYLGLEVLDHMVTLWLTIWGTTRLFPKQLYCFTFSTGFLVLQLLTGFDQREVTLHSKHQRMEQGVLWWLRELRIWHCYWVAWVSAVAWVWSLSQELLHALSRAKKKKKRERRREWSRGRRGYLFPAGVP